MAVKKTPQETFTNIRGKMPGDFKKRVRKFRQIRLEKDQPIPSDWEAIIALAERGIEAEGITL